MKLIHDCVRDVMLFVEENLKNDGKTLNAANIKVKHNSEDILYTCEKLGEANFLNIRQDILGNVIIISMTYNGHVFLDTIRDNNIWKKTKSCISKLTSVSLPMLQQVASSQILKELGI